VDAPLVQRLRENERARATGSNLDLVRSRVDAADYLTRLRAGMAGQANPYVGALTQFGQAYGNSYARRAGWNSAGPKSELPYDMTPAYQPAGTPA
jgi:hypothetical protein